MKRLTVLLTSLAMISLSISGDVLAVAEERSGFDKVWGYLTFYENKENKVIQKFALAGRAQIDSVWVAPDEQDNFSDINWRRFRFGAELVFLKEWVAHLEADFDLNEDINDWYNKLTDAYISWSPRKDLEIKVLKQSAGFTLDGSTSSKRLLTLERNNLTNNLWFTEEYFTGLLVKGKFRGDWSYQTSIFSSDGNPEIGVDGASWFTLWSLGYKLGNTRLRVDYVYQDEDENANTRDFEQVLSLFAQWQDGPWGVRGEVAGGKGFADQNQSDIWGINVMPFYDISKHTQLVLRYTYVNSEDDNGLRLNRYDNRVESGKGNEYNDVYAGFNVYFYSHKFKWQTGVSWAKMDDDANDGGEYEGWTLSTGLRVYW